jgi:hypothetical protein
MIPGMKSTNPSVLAMGLADRLATNAELSSIAIRSNLMRAFVLRIMPVIVALAFAAAFLPGAHAQTPPPSCTTSSDAAVQCFVANAVATGLTQPRYGMTLAQFQAYGVAVTKILQTDQTYIVLVGLSSAIADAMPPTNADGSFDTAAQETAIAQIVAAAATDGFVWPPSGTDLQDLQWFTQDLVNAMNVNQQVLQILTPGVTLRIIDSYIITATGSDGTVNWPQVNASLTTLVANFISSGLVRLTPSLTTAQLTAFVTALAQTISTYKVSTNRASL